MKKKELLFSVSMSVYHRDKHVYFQESLESIFNQSLLPDELILVVDGPVSREIRDIIQKFEISNNIKTIWLEKNMGHGYARRIGLNQCKHEFIAIMDSDDTCDLNRFKKQIECFHQNEELSVVGGSISEFRTDISNIVGNRILPKEDSDIKRFLKIRCPFNQMTVMFRKSEVEKAGG